MYKKIEFEQAIVALTGPSGSGKTTLGESLQRETNLIYLDVNIARLIFAPENLQRLSDEQERIKMIAAYAVNHSLAADRLREGHPVSVGATYSHPRYHEALRELSSLTKTPLEVFRLEVSEEVLAKRIAPRIKDEKDTSFVSSVEVAARIRASYVGMKSEDVHVIDTGLSVMDCTEHILEILTRRGLRKTRP